MLYISSRSKTDSFTSHRTLSTERAPDGGVYIPYKIPRLSAVEINELCAKSFSEIVSEVLNLFFTTKLSAWDIEVCAGKLPIRVKEVPYRLLIAECFHNPAGDYAYMEKNIYRKLIGADCLSEPSAWARIAIRIALLFGICANAPDMPNVKIDFSVISDDFLLPMAVWYAKEMGLPVCTIVCSSCGNSIIWDLIQRGELRIENASSIDQVEGLIYHRLGYNGVNKMVTACNEKGVYRIDENERTSLGTGFYASVVGADRIKSIIGTFEKTNNYRMTENAAIAYGGLQDYRAATGESRSTWILSDSKSV